MLYVQPWSAIVGARYAASAGPGKPYNRGTKLKNETLQKKNTESGCMRVSVRE